MYKSQQMLHAKRKSAFEMNKHRDKSKRTLTEMKALKLRHVITLKRWVFRTKRKLEVQTLADCERIAIQKYLKTCRKLCTLKSFNKQELKDVQKLHVTLIQIISKHLIHRHAEGIDMFEATLY